MGSGVAVATRGLVHIYRTEGRDVAALAGVNLDIAGGTTLGLLGPSGAGKSTLLTLLAGLDRPTAGTITVGETRIDQLTSSALDDWRRHHASLVLQGGARNLIDYLTVEENVKLSGLGSDGGPTAGDLLGMVGMAPDIYSRHPDQLSPTDTQLAALCVGVASSSSLLLADEPTASLDKTATQKVVTALLRLNAELGTTVLTVTHDPTLAEAMAQTVSIRDGRVGGQMRDGVELAILAPDGSLPLPDALLDTWEPGTAVQIEHHGETLIVKRVLEQDPT